MNFESIIKNTKEHNVEKTLMIIPSVSQGGTMGIFNLLIFSGILGVTVHASHKLENLKRVRDHEEEEIRQMFNAILTIGVLSWPVLWDSFIGYSSLLSNPRLFIAFLWVPLISIFQLLFISEVAGDAADEPSLFAAFQDRNLKQDAFQIISASFAIGNLIYSSTPNKVFHSSHIVLYGLLLTIAFVVPTIFTPTNTKTSIFIKSIQFVVLQYAIGLIICGIISNIVMMDIKKSIDVFGRRSRFDNNGVGGTDDSTVLAQGRNAQFGKKSSSQTHPATF